MLLSYFKYFNGSFNFEQRRIISNIVQFVIPLSPCFLIATISTIHLKMSNYNDLVLPEDEKLQQCPYHKTHMILKHR